LFPAEVFDIEGSRDTEGSECEGDTEGVSESEEGVMGRGVLGGRVLCAESGGRSDGGSDQEIHTFSRTKGEESGAVAVVLKSPVPAWRGFLLNYIILKTLPAMV
jgi:hypothetical protein